MLCFFVRVCLYFIRACSFVFVCLAAHSIRCFPRPLCFISAVRSADLLTLFFSSSNKPTGANCSAVPSGPTSAVPTCPARAGGECCICFVRVCFYSNSARFVCSAMCLYVLCIERDVNVLEKSMDPIVFVCLIAITHFVYSRSADKHKPRSTHC